MALLISPSISADLMRSALVRRSEGVFCG